MAKTGWYVKIEEDTYIRILLDNYLLAKYIS
jgi:hypothetical protein